MQAIQVTIINRIKAGYRRGGLVLSLGENRLTVNTAQLTALQQDRRLLVSVSNPHHENTAPHTAAGDESDRQRLSENATHDESESQLDSHLVPAALTVEQLKAKLTAFGVAFKATAKKDELVALLESTLATVRQTGA